MIWEEHTYLLVDNELVESEENTSMVRDEAYKHPANPIVDENQRDLFLGRQGYRIWPVCICRDSGRFRMWYALETAADAKQRKADLLPGCLAYAESDDGLVFRPVRARKGGPRALWRNVVRITDRPDLKVSGIMHDPADRGHPYKAVILRRGDARQLNPALQARYPAVSRCCTGHPSEGWFVWGLARSRDGFGWELPKHRANLVDAFIECPNVFRALDGGLAISGQMVSKVSDLGWRKVKGWVTYDGKTGHRIPDFMFSLPDHMTMVQPVFMQNMTWSNTPWVQSHMGLIPARKGPTAIALHGYLYGAIGCETYAQVADIGLAVSSTGYGFQQVWPFRPFLRRGNMGEWDCGLVFQGALVDTTNETRIYYGATPVGNADGCPIRLGVGIIGRDRYGYRVLRVYRDYANAKERRGTLTLKPLALPAKPDLAVNVSHVTPRQTVRVGLLDDRNRPIPGFSAAACIPITEEGLRRPVHWKTVDLRRLAGRTVKVQIELHSPDCRYADQHSPRVYAVYT